MFTAHYKISFQFTSIILAIVLLMASLSFLAGSTQVAEAQAPPLSADSEAGVTDPAELEAFLEDYLASQMEEHHIPGVVFTLVKDGDVFFSKGYGYADLEKQVPFDVEQTVLTTASVGKAFTALAVLQLYEQGSIDLHEDVRPYINDFELPDEHPGTLTFANLLTHTDGFEARMIGVAGLSEDDLLPLEALLTTYMPRQIYSPGEYMTYGNFAANLAGYLVAEISDTTFEQYMDRHILKPLGMTNSTFDQHLSDEMMANLAQGYEYQNGSYEQMPFFYIRFAPEGGLRTTAADMSRFMIALLGGGTSGTRILTEESTQLMFTQQFAPHPKMAGISYGLFEQLANEQQLFLRDGDGVGTKSRMVLLPEQNMGFYISYNSGDNALRLSIIDAFLDHYYPVDESSAPTPVADYQERASQFAGSYRPLQADLTSFAKSQYFFAGTIEVAANDEGYLLIEPVGMGDVMGGFEGVSQWVEVEPLYLQQVDGQGKIAFAQDENGQITHLYSGQGYHGVYSKLPWYETRSFHMILIALVAIILISMVIVTFVIWPLGALIRKLRHKPAQNPGFAKIAARLWSGVVSGMLAFFAFRTIGVLYAIGSIAGMPNYVFGVTNDMVDALNSLYLPVMLALALPIFTILAFRNGWWKLGTRLHYTLVTLAVFAGIWWVHYWNLLGFQM